ncbi:MAG TPA: hypothetical protein PKK07_02500 [bacterium]|nr:hypothetical protein [bacterium]
MDDDYQTIQDEVNTEETSTLDEGDEQSLEALTDLLEDDNAMETEYTEDDQPYQFSDDTGSYKEDDDEGITTK